MQATASLPQTVTLSGRRFVLNRLDGVDADEEGQWVVYPAQCPHQLGSLESAPLVDGVVRCPWHGYEFDVRTGACISGSHCQFGRMPTVAEQAGTFPAITELLTLKRPITRSMSYYRCLHRAVK